MINDSTHKPLAILQMIPTPIVGFSLIGAAILFLKPDWGSGLYVELQHPIADALLIAGLLTVIVDPFLKARLFREVSSGTFQYLLGFAQPPEIQDAMRRLAFETKLYARDLRLRYRIEREDERSVRTFSAPRTLKTRHQKYSNTNPSWLSKRLRSPQSITFWSSERTAPRLIPIISGQTTRTLESWCSVLVRECSIQVNRSPWNSVFCRAARSLFSRQYFGRRTIGVTVSADGPGFDVSSDFPEGQAWQTKRLFLVGEKLTLRWKPKAS